MLMFSAPPQSDATASVDSIHSQLPPASPTGAGGCVRPGALRRLPELTALFDQRPRWEVPALYARATVGDRYAFAILLLRAHRAPARSVHAARLAHAAARLSDVHRRYLVLHCLAGMSVPELAATLRRPAPAVMGSLHWARVQLGDALPVTWRRSR